MATGSPDQIEMKHNCIKQSLQMFYCQDVTRVGQRYQPIWLHFLHVCRNPVGCSDTSIDSDFGNLRIRSGQSFILTCEFSCLMLGHTIQWWKDSQVLLNASSSRPNISLSLHVRNANVNDSGNYSCKTKPPNAIGTVGNITVEDFPTVAVSTDPESIVTSTVTVSTFTPPPSPSGLMIIVVACYLLLKAGLLITMVTTASMVLFCRTG
ncbi:hypothetical protein DPEC_G00053880 [Dallia pectoralis]|uniref:Uncharacterized protein n=1 Tax=Dallia pectoralis TaxID=75939 RepID=A0ACC2H5L9_DALPE|nr:hypothetical protein DPEC_G00053880 [Dallia pectoralis]